MGITQLVKMRPGWLLRSHPISYPLAYHAQQQDPEQIRELDVFISHCREKMVFFDIGAHFGIFSFAALHFGGKDAQAVAVDPSPAATRILGIQANLNEVGARLHIVRACAGDNLGSKSMVTTGASGLCYFVPPMSHHGAREITKSDSITLDSLAQTYSLGPTHIKIDVEGAEASVLKGGQNILTKFGPVLFLELHNQMMIEQGSNPAEVLMMLQDLHYQLFRLDGAPICNKALLSLPLARVVAKRITS